MKGLVYKKDNNMYSHVSWGNWMIGLAALLIISLLDKVGSN